MIPNSLGSMLHRLALWILLAVLCSAVIRFMLMLDINKRVYNHTPGPCRVVPDMNDGSAGMELIKETGDVFITYGLDSSIDKKIGSGIAVYETSKENSAHSVTKLQISGDQFDKRAFSPRGISSYHSKGRTTLYVVNAHPARNCVEVFLYKKESASLMHRKAICDPRFSSLSDIAVVGADRFFLSNVGYFSAGPLQMAELALQSSFGSLFFYDGRNISTALGGLPSPSALAFDEKRSLLYLGSMLSEVIRVYHVEKDLSLVHRVEISLLSSPASIHVDDESGDLWVALHPVIYQLFIHSRYSTDKKIHSPSQILRVRVQPDGVSWVVTEPYANDGATIAGSNAVVFYKDELFIGSLYGRTLHCDVLNAHIT